MRKLTTAIIFFSTLCLSAVAQTNISGIINTYTKVTSISNGCSCPSTNCATVTVTSAVGFAASDIVMIIQMKGARADSSNTASHGSILSLYDAGNYEFDTIASIAGSVITLKIPLANTYFTNASVSDSAYVQLIKVPVYASANVNGALTPQAWNPGTGTGGVLVFFVTGTLTLNANISADGYGFNAATYLKEPLGCDLDTNFYYQSTIWNYASCTTCGYIYDDSPTRYADAVAFGGCAAPCQTNRMSSSDWKQAGFRGEGIVAFTFKKTFANANVALFKLGKAKWGNGGGGGGNHNAGGGGGGNYGTGGWGGNAFNVVGGGSGCTAGTLTVRRGYGGAALTPTASKIFMGGGGGEGHDDGGQGTTGANGGGIIIIQAATVTNGGAYTITANGASQNTVAIGDGAGGGGAGGSILLQVSGSYTNAVTIQAKGGKGGDHNNNTCHGTGGGGGGGVIWFSQGSTPANVTTSVTGGANGVQVAATIDCGDVNWGATAGSAGGVLYGNAVGATAFLNMNNCNTALPVELVSFDGVVNEQGVELNWTTASEINNDHFSIERTEDLMTYTNIGSIPASGNSSISREYSFYDNHAPAKELYYRLKQVDFDGKVHYPGRLVRINNQDAGLMPIISPNPNDGRSFTLNLSSFEDKEALVRIVDNMGKIVWEQFVDLRNYGDKLVSVNTGHNFETGIYTLRVTSLSGQQTKRFMVARKEE
jgi:hypothetical protein